MKDCRTCEEKLPAYLEGAVSVTERQEMDRHLASCDRCRSTLRDLKKTGNLLSGLEEKEPPPWFTQQVMARVREEAGEKKGLLRKLFFPLQVKIPLEVAASLLVAVLAWQVYRASPPEMKALPEAPSSPLILQQKSITKDAGQGATSGPSSSPGKKAAAGSAPLSQPESAVGPGESGAGKLKKQEEVVPAARSVETPALEEKKTLAADKAETPRPLPAPLKKSEPEETRPAQAPAPVFPAAPRRVERELKEKDESQKLEAVRDQARVMGKMASEIQVLTVRVREVDPALKAVRGLLQRSGAENIREESGAGRKTIDGVIRAGVLGGLVEQLKALGEVSPKGLPGQAAGETVLIRIEIIAAVP